MAGTTNRGAHRRRGRCRRPDDLVQVPGDPRKQLPRADGLGGDSTSLAIQQLKPPPDGEQPLVGDAEDGKVRSVLVDRDAHGSTSHDDHVEWGPGPSLPWTPDNSKFIW